MYAFLDLKAINPERNIDRFYSIYIDKTLFNEPFLTINHGRNRFRGRTISYYFEDQKTLEKKLVHILKRRFTAKKRLGTNYELTASQWDAAFNNSLLPLLYEKKLLTSQ